MRWMRNCEALRWLDRRADVGNLPMRMAQERDFMWMRPVKTGPVAT